MVSFAKNVPPTDMEGVARILVVDDDIRISSACQLQLSSRGHRVHVANTMVAARGQIDGGSFDAWLVDLNVDQRNDGLELLELAKTLDPAPVLFIMTGSTLLQDAFAVGRAGAVNFVTKPVDFDDVCARLARSIRSQASRNRRKAKGPVIVSDAMRRVMDQAERLAATPSSSALILGESGVGKEIVAAHIHERSARSSRPFVRVNLAAFPETMVDAELFGTVRGAYTGSMRDRTGLIASADTGTLLLDELCEFRVHLQPKLLRVLEDRRFFPVGSDLERTVDVRVLAATNREPYQAIEEGVLRADLFYRLSAGILHVPPLRERRADVLPMMSSFLEELAVEAGSPIPVMSKKVMDALLAHPWPGNVRELRNVAARVSMMASGRDVDLHMLGFEDSLQSGRAVMESGDFPVNGSPQASDASERPLEAVREEIVASLERARIEQALAKHDGSRTNTAKILGMSRSTLWEKMKRYGIAYP